MDRMERLEERVLDLERKIGNDIHELSEKLSFAVSDLNVMERTVEYDRVSDTELRSLDSKVDSLESRVQTLEYLR